VDAEFKRALRLALENFFLLLLHKSHVKNITSKFSCVVPLRVVVNNGGQFLDPDNFIHLSKIHQDVLKPSVLIVVGNYFLFYFSVS
jgi:hypothetical protein